MGLQYDERELIEKLNRLSKPLRAVFAALCAERLLPAHAEYCKRVATRDPLALPTLLSRLWEDLDGDPMSPAQLAAAIDTCTELIPREDEEPWIDLQPYAEDAGAAVAYALRTRITGASQEAAWAARRAYEAMDHSVISREGVEANSAGEEARVLAHPLVQAELARQQRDLEDLDKTGKERELISSLRARAQRDAIQWLGA
jgi:uncharacterized protein YjaG (DUF416 family)